MFIFTPEMTQSCWLIGQSLRVQVRGAIGALEARKAALMRSVAQSNVAELERACAASRMPLPQSPPGLTDTTVLESGQVSSLAGHAA